MTTGSTGIRFSEQSTGYLNNRGFHVNKQVLLTLSYFLRGLSSGRSLRLGALVVAGASVTSLAVNPAVLGRLHTVPLAPVRWQFAGTGRGRW
jgi:hypothetical protein